MKKRFKILFSMVLVLILAFSITQTAFAATWSSSDKYASWSNGGYMVYNNVWGGGSGYQSIWANSYSNWGVWSDQPNTGGIKSYPNSTKNVNATLSSLSYVSSSFNVSVPSGGSYESTYDIWCNNNAYEIMLWMNYTGNVQPISYNWNQYGQAVPYYTNVYIGGYSWNIYRGNNGSNEVFSFLPTYKVTSGTVDVLAVLNWIKSVGWYGDVTLGDVQFGFEITSSAGGMSFNCNSYSVSYAKQTSSGAVQIRNRATNINIDGYGYTGNGSDCKQYSDGGSYNQQWYIEQDGSYVKIKNRATGLYLDGMGRTNYGATCGQWSSSSSYNQKWVKESVGGGFYKFKNAATGLYLDGRGNYANGTTLGQWGDCSSYNIQWYIETP